MSAKNTPDWTPWETISRRTLLKGNRFLSVEEHTLRLPDGRILDDWAWVITPDYVTIATVDERNRFLCFRQTKYAVDGLSLAPPGGYLDPGETPEAGARRELMEETGCEAERWVSLGRYAVDANRGAGTAHFFLATGVRRIGAPSGGDLEAQEPLWLDAGAVRAALDRNEFKALAWAAVMEMALQRVLLEPGGA
jgi:ADP-ribose pyrophosphatase